MPYSQLKAANKDRILVVIEPHSDVERLLRAAKRRVDAHHVSWEVVFIESSAVMRGLDLEERERILRARATAEQMGALVTPLQTRTSLHTILSILDERRKAGTPIGTIIIGSGRRRRGLSQLQPSLAHQLKQRFGSQSRIHLVILGAEIIGTQKLSGLIQVSFKEIVYSLLAVVAATALIEIMDYLWPLIITDSHRNKSLIYMIICAFAAVRFGLLAGLVAGVASFLTLCLLYIEPIGSLFIHNATAATNLAIFLFGVIAISFFGNQEHIFKEDLEKRADRLQSLLRLHRITLNQRSAQETIKLLDEEITKFLKTDIMFFLPTPSQQNKLETLHKKDITLSPADEKAMYLAWEDSKTTGVGTSFGRGCEWRFEPLTTFQGELGVFGVHIANHITIDAAFSSMLNGIADQVALILERLELGLVAEEVRMQAEREKLRAMLLSSVSHDLKTPLASVIGALSVYRSMGARLPEEQRMTLISTALDEAQRLDSFITNILDMTRIESGQVEMKGDWVNPRQLISDVIKRLRDRVRNHEVVVHGEDKAIDVMMDGMMTGQILQNLLDNAAKYTPVGTKIEVSWKLRGSEFVCEVRDHGPGIPEDQLEKVFDKYTRLKRQDSQVAGTGLGLAIARAVMRAQGGSIAAANHPTGGALFTLTLPNWRNTPTDGKKAA